MARKQRGGYPYGSVFIDTFFWIFVFAILGGLGFLGFYIYGAIHRPSGQPPVTPSPHPIIPGIPTPNIPSKIEVTGARMDSDQSLHVTYSVTMTSGDVQRLATIRGSGIFTYSDGTTIRLVGTESFDGTINFDVSPQMTGHKDMPVSAVITLMAFGDKSEAQSHPYTWRSK